MSLTLEHVSRVVEGQTWIDDASLRFEAGSFNVLLGRTLSGKTSLMRLMAGLDKPDSGRILMNGVDVTHKPVRLRNVSNDRETETTRAGPCSALALRSSMRSSMTCQSLHRRAISTPMR